MKSALRHLVILFTILCGTTISGASIQEAQAEVIFGKACFHEGELGFSANFNAPKTTPVGSTRHVEIPPAENGAYFGMLENGKAYVGKGPPSRARKSLRKKSREQNSPVDDIAHYPEAASFAKEAELIEDLGGLDAPDLLNKINSPGKK